MLRKLADRVKDIFEGRLQSYNNIIALMTMFLFCFDTLSNTVRCCPWSHSVSDLSRAVNDFDGNRFMRRFRKSILRKYKGKMNPDDFCYAIDDTDNPKFGKNIYRIGNWHSSKGPYRGQKILVIVLVDINQNFAIPLSYAFIAKKGDPKYKSGIDLSFDLLKELVDAGFPKLKVAADSWFDSAALITKLKSIGLEWAGEIKGNRNIKSNPSPNSPWMKLPALFVKKDRVRLSSRFDNEKIRSGKKRGKCAAEATIMIKDYKSPLKCIAVYNKKNSTRAFAYYVTTDLSLSGAKIWEFSRARWKIECMFYDLKQNLSFGRLPCEGQAGADMAVCFPMFLYTSLRLDDPNDWGLEKKEGIGKMVDKIKEKMLTNSINQIIAKPNDKKVIQLGARRKISNVNKKPVNMVAERNLYGKMHAA
jgi:hypothetical protein